MKAHDRGEFAAQLVTDPFIEILGPEKSLHMGQKSPDFRSPKSRGNPDLLFNLLSIILMFYFIMNITWKEKQKA